MLFARSERYQSINHRLPTRDSEAGYKDPRRLNIPLPGGETFNLHTFIDEKEAQTNWVLAQQCPSMIELIEQVPGRDKTAATCRCSVNQDHEGFHRRVKIGWAKRNNQTPFSNQHDGIGIGLDAQHDPKSVAESALNRSDGYPWVSSAY